MTRSRQQTILDQLGELTRGLRRALAADDYRAATRLAQELQTLGIQSLDRLTSRGTLRFPASNRWEDERLSREVLERLGSPAFPEPLAALLVNVLGYWAGEEAVPGIHHLLVERVQRGESTPEIDPIARSGLEALYLIGGPEAAQTLYHFQGRSFPLELRREATRFLNELGSRSVDLQFGSEDIPEPETAEEVHLIDSLRDPYCWKPAAESVGDFLRSVGRSTWIDYRKELTSVLPSQATTAVRCAFEDPSSAGSVSEQWLGCLEPAVPHFVVCLAGHELLALNPVCSFFPAGDVLEETREPVFRDWSFFKLCPGSASARFLGRLPLFRVSDAGAGPAATRSRRALRSWVSQLVMLAQEFQRRREPALMFCMAALQYRTHEELELPRSLSFPELVQAMFRSYPEG